MKNKKFYILHFTFYILIIITLSFCTTSPQSGSLTGTINLEDQSDHSNITIGIYELAELDPDIVEANQKWPHIGVIINQMTEFDHRFGTLIKTGETDASGYFKIENISTGVYNVVAIKDGFGFRYLYEISISEGDNSLSNLMKQSPLNDCFEVTDKNFEMNSEKCKMNNESFSSPHYSLSIMHYTLDSKADTLKADLILFPETIISADITTATTFESYHHYIIEQDIIVDDELTIEPGAVVRLNEGKEITSYGTFHAVGEYENFIWFTKNDGFSENLSTIEPDSNYIWDRVTLEPYSQAQVHWCKFDWANIVLLNHTNGFEISDCIFRKSNCGFKAEGVDSTFCSNLLCEDITNGEQGGIYYLQVSEGLIEKNIVKNCENGIKIKDGSSPAVENNYIQCCNNSGIDISYYSFSDIKNNEIYSCEIGIYASFSVSLSIYYNIIKSLFCIQTFHLANNSLIINHNNLEFELYSIYLGWASYENINAENNYFFSNNNDVIQESIFDKNDVELSQQQNYGIVDYQPFLTQEYTNAGIQGE